MRPSRFLILPVLATAWSFSACTMIDALTKEEEHSPVTGKTLEYLARPKQMQLTGGILYVADNAERSNGFALIDTSADTVSRFFRFSKHAEIETFLVYHDSLIVSHTTKGTVRDWIIGGLDITSGKAVPDPLVLPYSNTKAGFALYEAGGAVFFSEHYANTLRGVLGSSLNHSFGDRLGLPVVAFADGSLYVTLRNSRFLMKLPLSPGAVDSTDLASFHTDELISFEPTAVVAHGQRLFVSVKTRIDLAHQDSLKVMVINKGTMQLESVISLRFPLDETNLATPYKPRVVDGVWYLCGGNLPVENGGMIGDGGVEAIDLATATYRGVVLDEATAGGNILDFIPAGPGKGYALLNFGKRASGVRRVIVPGALAQE